MSLTMENVSDLIESLGALHDARVLELLWRRDERVFEIGIQDLYVDLEGFADYPGLTKARFVLSDVSKLDLDINLTEAGMIYEWTFKRTGPPIYEAEILFSPAGKAILEFGRIECLRG